MWPNGLLLLGVLLPVILQLHLHPRYTGRPQTQSTSSHDEIAATYENMYAITTDGRIYVNTEAVSTLGAGPTKPDPFGDASWSLSDTIDSLTSRPISITYFPVGYTGRMLDVITADGNHYRLVTKPPGGYGVGRTYTRPTRRVGNVFGY